MKFNFLLISCVLLINTALAQTFTMGNKCYEQSRQASALLTEKKYAEALNAFTTLESSCKTKDARETIQSGKAAALNGLGKHEEAITASDLALKASKNKSIKGYFQKALALNALQRPQEASACFSKLIALTEKNRDTKSRASNYALLADLYQTQLHHTDSAGYFLDKAKVLDPSNTSFVIMEGDWKAAEGNYNAAFEAYDKAVTMGKTDLDMYLIRTQARLKMVQEKYGTTNAQELRSKMTELEKKQVCEELKKAQSKGLKEMKLDLFASLVCK